MLGDFYDIPELFTDKDKHHDQNKINCKAKGDWVVWVGDQNGAGRVAQVVGNFFLIIEQCQNINFMIFKQEFHL